MNLETNTISGRPEFMAALDLLPPYTLEDVRKAYQAKARVAHPDAGGDASAFVEIAEAYQRAVEYVEYRASPREWVAARVERYVEQDEFISRLKAVGGAVELEDSIWRRRDLGEFGQVGDQIVAVMLNESADVEGCFKLLREKPHLFEKLVLVDLGNSGVTDTGLAALPALGAFRRLDLRNTAVTYGGLRILRELKELTTLNLGGTRIHRWHRYRLGRRFPNLRILTQPDVALNALASPVGVLAGG